ncbi:unnamed protein product [Plasmodium vivax]|uniref:(malaria parasite P. vivax) hypothetical protein n=1 Tax=Plasmodium vivax TaxID=5855 RepID=A0A8S4H6H8_PLAVI|nr:unnamed protein product [Plasmodium vivax]
MPCSKHSEKYLNYNCYSTLKSHFDTSRLTDDGKKVLNITFGYFKDESRIINANLPIFNEFARILTADHVFSQYGKPLSCMYINFWLNEEIKNNYNDRYVSNFNLFDNFATKFATERDKDGYSKNLCKIHINELVDDEYRKKQILYKLYNLYNDYKKPPKGKTSEQLCNNFNLMHIESRGASDNIKQDVKFVELLKELKTLIKNDKSYKEICKNQNIPNFILPDEIAPPNVEVPVMPVNELALAFPLQVSERDDLEHRVSEVSAVFDEVLPETEELGQQAELQTFVSPTANKLSENLQEKPPYTVSQKGYLLHSTRSQEHPFITTWPQETRILEQDRGLPQTRNQLLDDTKDIRNQTGALGSIQNTLTEFLGSVEPAPILGVSGGMGALFLLFKYTPVGTFFRGRRGRTYGIPSGFNEPFQGGLPVYDDYYGGNVGSDRFHVSYQAE